MHRLFASLLLLALSVMPALAQKTNPFAGQTALVMVDARDCSWCRKWDREVGVGYANTEEGGRAPLIRLQRGDARLGPFRGVGYTPTFILVVDGQEQGRITGYPGADFFWAELGRLLQKSLSPENRAHVPLVSRS